MINGINVYYYIIQIVLGIIAGTFSAIAVIRYKDEKKVFCKETLDLIKRDGIPNLYTIILVNIGIYLVLLYFIGISTTFLGNLNLIKYMLITPLLIVTFVVDVKLREIPNRVTLFLFELALINILILAFSNVNISLDAIYGALFGAGVFIFLNIFGKLIYRQEAMGMGDVKLMGPLGAILGFTMTINLTLIAFVLASVIGILVLLVRKTKKDEDGHIPFGPFLVISAYIMMVLPHNYAIEQFLRFSNFLSEVLMKLVN